MSILSERSRPRRQRPVAEPLATAIRSWRFLAKLRGYPPPHVEMVAEHLGRGGSVADCPGLAEEDRAPLADLLGRRTGLITHS